MAKMPLVTDWEIFKDVVKILYNVLDDPRLPADIKRDHLAEVEELFLKNGYGRVEK